MLHYWRDEEATQETVRDGWFYTGDLGSLDEDGYLRITGRKKEMIKTATGKNVFPAHLETLLCRDPFILQALVVGDDRKCLAALIVPDPDVLGAEIRRLRLWVWSKRSAVRHPRIQALYRERIDRQLAGLSPHEQVRYFTVLDRGFTIENGHLTRQIESSPRADFAGFRAGDRCFVSREPLIPAPRRRPCWPSVSGHSVGRAVATRAFASPGLRSPDPQGTPESGALRHSEMRPTVGHRLMGRYAVARRFFEVPKVGWRMEWPRNR